ncbi:MAG: hypothetical protein ACTSRG_21210 [Candidatus Helarchaeota archaeon]
MDLKDKASVEKTVKSLIKDVQKENCTKNEYEQLGSILNQIANFPEYQDLYDEAADELIEAGVDLEKCGCDPITKKIPADKEKLIPEK